eukprot:1358278-Amorphochlora_amoeboformis.AAC.1
MSRKVRFILFLHISTRARCFISDATIDSLISLGDGGTARSRQGLHCSPVMLVAMGCLVFFGFWMISEDYIEYPRPSAGEIKGDFVRDRSGDPPVADRDPTPIKVNP